METPFFFADGRARLVSLAVFLVFFFADAAAIRTRLGRDDQNRDQGSKQAIMLLQFAGLVAGFLLAFVKPLRLPGSPWVWVVAGTIVVLLGTGLRVWSIRTLGDFFTRDVGIRPGHRLVTAGPYRWLMHPSYAAALLGYAGMGVIMGSWLSVAAVLGLTLVSYLRRIRVEELVLQQNFGTEFDTYRARRSRLVPGIW